MRRASLSLLLPSLAFASALLLLAGCDCEGPAPVPIDAARDAGTDGEVIDSSYDGGNVPDDAGICSQTGRRVCGELCCDMGEVCGSNDACCPLIDTCGTECCGDGQVCEGAVCRLDCGTQTRCFDEDESEVCCGDGEVCINRRCFAPTVDCVEFIDCEDGFYCETTTGECLPQPAGEECVDVPEGGEVVPTLLWHWDGSAPGEQLPEWNQVMMTPLVVNLTDDNGDGLINVEDTPDVVFITFCGPNSTGACTSGNVFSDGVLRAVDGATGETLWTVTSERLVPGGQLAAGDLDGDGMVEIVGCRTGFTRDLVAFNHDGSTAWRSFGGGVINCGQAGPSIADLDADGTPEVFVRYAVVNGEDGSLEWNRTCAGTGGWSEPRNDHDPCDYTTAADLDGDGQLEIVGGNVAYRADGSLYYDHRPGCSAPGCAATNDGYPAVGDLDLDGTPEVVVLQSAFFDPPYAGDHWIRVFEHDGTERLAMPLDANFDLAPFDDIAIDRVAGGGPPTIANFDSDPEPEIAYAGAYGYVVLDQDGTRLWSAITDDRSSRKTGSSVFDFDGDGVAEAVYADQNWMRVYDGPTGEVQFCICNTSATLWEYPVIADVNNDAHAEIVLASNDYTAAFESCVMQDWLGACEIGRLAAGDSAGTHGVRVFASPSRDWVATRRIWNQHSYHVTNVTENGQIPQHEIPNWSRSALNNFRQNVQPGALNIPDLVPVDLSVGLNNCFASVTLNFRVENQGWASAPAEVPITIYVLSEDGSTWQRQPQISTSRVLLPSESEAFSFEYTFPIERDPGEPIRFRVVINDPDDFPTDTLNECRPLNNTAEVEGDCGFFG